MNQEQQQLKSQLLHELHTSQNQQEGNQRFGLGSAMNESVGELSGYDNHPADLGSEMFERGKDLALQDATHRREEEIKLALSRMEKGEYGICEICHTAIPFERLEVLPWTRYCVTHSQDFKVASQRPIEEEVIQELHREQENSGDSGYNGEDAWQEVERYGTSTST